MTENAATTDALTADAAPAVETQIATPEVSEDDALGAVFDRLVTNNGAERGADGRFTGRDTGGEGDGASSGGEEGAGADLDAAAGVEVPPAPANWNGLDDAWKALPAEHRERVKSHFEDLHRRMSDQGRQLASVKPIADRMAQAAQAIPLFKNMSPEQISERALELAAVSVNLKRDPVGTLLEVAQSVGALPALAAKLTGQQMPEGAQEVSSLKQEIADLKRQLQTVSDPAQIETTVSRVYEGRAAQEAVNQFASDPANSFFADVEPHLPTFIPLAREAKPGASIRDVLQSAYDMAIHAIPEVRAKVEAAAKKAAAAQPDLQRTEAAKKAASINVKSSSTGKERQLTEFEALGSAYDRAMAS